MEIRDTKLRQIVAFLKGTQDAKDVYGSVVNDLFRQRYTQDKVEAINNIYLDDMENVEHIKERDDMKAYRRECKLEAKRILGIEED